jgi:hypothetical protein
MKCTRQFLFLIPLFLFSYTSFSQLSREDSLVIRELNAANLTDSRNSKIPKSIRLLIIDYFIKNGLNPIEYYTTYIMPFKKGPCLAEYGCPINLMKIGALRDLYYNPPVPGAAGEEGDDLLVIFDKDYKKILKVLNSE